MCNLNFDDISSTQLALPAEMGGLGFSSASLLALPAFLASAFGASDFLTMIFSGTFEDVSFTKAFEKWLSLTNEQESPLDGTQKNWTQPVYVKTAQDLISRMDDKRSKVFNAHQGKFGSQWLNVVPCKNLGLKLDDQQLFVPISSSSTRPLGATYIPILLSEVEQEQRPSGNGDREAIVVGTGLCDGEGERAYIAYIMRDVSANFLA